MPLTPSTFRSDVVARLVALGNEFIGSNPTMLGRFYSRRPPSLSSRTPCGFVGTRNETVTHTSGLRQRTMAPTLVLVDRMWTDEETEDRLDDLVDSFLDYLTARPHAISSNTVMSPTAVEDVELEEGGAVYPAVVFTLGETLILEGRQ